MSNELNPFHQKLSKWNGDNVKNQSTAVVYRLNWDLDFMTSKKTHSIYGPSIATCI